MDKPQHRLKRLVWLTMIALAAIALLFGFWWQSSRSTLNQNIKLENGRLLRASVPLKKFQLINARGQRYSNENLQGHWTLMFFGFTHCPIRCTNTLAELNNAYRQLSAKGSHAMPQVVFISTDPKRDQPRTIKNYLANFNDNFIGLTGSLKQINSLTKQIDQNSMQSPSNSSMILVLNPNGEWEASLRPPYNGKSIAENLLTLQQAY